MGTWVGAKEGLVVGTWVLGAKEGLVVGTMQVLTAQKGPPVEVGVVWKMHPEF